MRYDELVKALEVVLWEAVLNPFRLTGVSEGARRLIGYTPEELIERPEIWRASVFQEDCTTLKDALDAASPANNQFAKVYKFTKPTGERAWLYDLVTIHFKKKKPDRLSGITIDVTERVELERALRMVVDIDSEAVDAQDVTSLSALCLRQICKTRRWRVGQAWFLNEAETELVCSQGAFYSELPVDEFRRESLRRTFPPGTGLPGATFKKRSTRWIPDLAKEENFPRAKIALKCGLKSAFAFPIKHGDKVFGIFEFFDDSIRQPDKPFLAAVEQLSMHLSSVFERILAEEKLKKQKEEQQIIFDSVPALIWYKDRENRILRANKHAAEASGLTVEEIAGKSTYDLFPLEAEMYFQDDLEVIESGRPKLGIVEPFRTTAGETRWVSTDKIPYLDEDGKIKGVIVFAQDITDRKLAEEKLLSAHADLEQKVQERTRELQEANIYFKLTREMFAIAGFDGYFKQLNPAWEETLGYSVEELLSKPYMEFVHPDDREKTKVEGERLSRGEYVQFFENRYIARDGTEKFLLWSASSDLKSGVIYAVAHDVTARRQAESELHDISARIANLARHLPGILYQFSMSDSGEMNFTYVSESSRNILGYEPRELEGSHHMVFSLVHPDDLPVLHKAIVESNATRSTFKFEGRMISRSGVVKWIRASSTPERQPNGDMLWNGLLMDITDLKTAEEKVRQLNEDLAQRVSILAAVNQELEILTHKLELAYDEALEASKLKSEFVANISHEVRTPISAVLGMAELLMDTPLSQEQQSFVRIVSESAQSLLTIINDILDFSKMEAGRLELEVIDINIRSIVEGCADWLASAARRKQLELMTFCDPSIPPLLKGDPVRLRQVLLNLTSNAIKFTDDGEVVIRATKFRETEEKTVVLFQVSDTGIGLSDPARKRLFQPFAQADGSTTRKYGGTGLGLSISKRLVEMMGGEIGVHSEEDKGSTFWFTVPLARERWGEQPEPRPDLSSDISYYKILLINESITARSIIAAYLENAGVERIEIADASDCQSVLDDASSRGIKFDYSIVDVSEDSARGFALAEKLASSYSDTAGNIIALAAFDERERMESAQARGVYACLSKPLRRSHLIDAVVRTHGGMPSTAENEIEAERLASLALAADPRYGRDLAATSAGEYAVLLAEDNPVLQQLAQKQLEKFGLNVVVVGNGKLALEQAFRRTFAMIFMDCQMPEMDGYEATMAIREIESRGGSHIPIIAMTASAMPSDRERCLNSGMDDYLSKPVSQMQLMRILETWLPAKAAEVKDMREQDKMQFDSDGNRHSDGKQHSDANGNPVNVAELSRLYGEEDLVDILKMFLDESGDLLRSMEISLDKKDDRELANLAHQLKGLSAVLCANELTRFSLELEKAAKTSSWEPARAALASLNVQFATVTDFVKSFLGARGALKDQP